jgi:hypothetical protein
MTAMLLFIIVFIALPGFCISACAAALLYSQVLEEVRPDLPPQFRERSMEGYAVDIWIWGPRLPVSLRHKYLWSQALMAISFACLAIIVHKDIVIAMLVAVGSVLFLGSVLWRLVKYRDRL